MSAGVIPDRGIVAALKRIDPELSVAFADPPGRFAVYYAVPFEGNSDEACRRLAQGLKSDYSEKGYMVPFAECERQAFQGMQDANLVCYVADDDGGYRPLDQRIVTKVERMDYYRRNLGIKDWKSMLNVKADAIKAQREREIDDIWETVRKDRVWGRMGHDLLWGCAPARSVMVPDNFGDTGAAKQPGEMG